MDRNRDEFGFGVAELTVGSSFTDRCLDARHSTFVVFFCVWLFALRVQRNEAKCVAPLARCTTGRGRHRMRSLQITLIYAAK